MTALSGEHGLDPHLPVRARLRVRHALAQDEEGHQRETFLLYLLFMVLSCLLESGVVPESSFYWSTGGGAIDCL